MSLEDKLYPLLSVYERLPRGIKRAVGFTYRQLPESYRRGAQYRAFKELAEEGEHWTKEEIAEFQFEELRKVLLHGQQHCPYYRKRFAEAGFDAAKFSSSEELRNCPAITKQDLLEHREEMVSEAFPASERLYITTGGSTGVPVGFYLQKGVSRAKETINLFSL